MKFNNPQVAALMSVLYGGESSSAHRGRDYDVNMSIDDLIELVRRDSTDFYDCPMSPQEELPQYRAWVSVVNKLNEVDAPVWGYKDGHNARSAVDRAMAFIEEGAKAIRTLEGMSVKQEEADEEKEQEKLPDPRVMETTITVKPDLGQMREFLQIVKNLSDLCDDLGLQLQNEKARSSEYESQLAAHAAASPTVVEHMSDEFDTEGNEFLDALLTYGRACTGHHPGTDIRAAREEVLRLHNTSDDAAIKAAERDAVIDFKRGLIQQLSGG